jgi:hypothetical protein
MRAYHPHVPRFFLIGFLVALPLVAFTACGGGDGAEPTPTATGEPVNDQTPLPSPAGTPVGPLTDAEYLAVICSGLSEYSAAIIREQTEEGLSAVVVDYVVSLQAVLPPEDLTGFHNDFIVYLSAAVASPTDLLALPRPLPPDDIRERLSDIEEDVEECRDARFFHVRPEDES